MSDEAAPADAPQPEETAPSRVEFVPSDAISFGWRILKKEPIVILVLLLAAVVSNALPNVGSAIETSGQMNRGFGERPQFGGGPLYWILFVVNLPISAWIACGTWRYLLKVARGQPADVGDLFSGGPVLTMLGALLLFSLGVMLGTCLLVVPGIIFGLGCCLYGPLIVDTHCGAVEALKASWDLTKGKKGRLFVLWLLMILVMIAGFLACCLGVLVALPIVQFAMAYAYLTLTAQPFVQPPA